jgi:hypothetical protein
MIRATRIASRLERRKRGHAPVPVYGSAMDGPSRPVAAPVLIGWGSRLTRVLAPARRQLLCFFTVTKRAFTRGCADLTWGIPMLKTKSVWSSPSPEDGLRILATRFRGRGLPGDRYDVWMASL